MIASFRLEVSLSIRPVLLLLALVACGQSSDPAPTPAPETPTAPAPEATPPTPQPTAQVEATPGGAVVRESSFELRGDTRGPYHSGQLGQLSISITALEGWHVNQEFPTSVEILNPPAGMTFPKTTLEKADLAQLTETNARFDVPFTPTAAGSQTVQAKVSFAVCTDENCVPAEHTLALTFPVE